MRVILTGSIYVMRILLDHGESTAIMISAQNQGDFVRHLLLGHRMTLKWQYLGSLCFYDALSVSFDRWELHQPLIPFVAQNREHVELMTKFEKWTRTRLGLYYKPGGGIRYELAVFEIADIVTRRTSLPTS